MRKLYEKGIDTRSFFYPMNKQPAFKGNDERFPDLEGDYPVAEELYKKGFYLPSSSSLTEGQIKKVVEKITEIKNEK